MKKLKKHVFAAVLASLMMVTAMPTVMLYASAETESVSGNAIEQEDTGTDDAGEIGGSDTGKPETNDTEEPAQEPPTSPRTEETESEKTEDADTSLCAHHREHTADCGYSEEDNTSCGYECRICPIEELIAALPEEVTEDNADEVRAQLEEILDRYRELEAEEQEQIDLSRCYDLQETLAPANVPAPAVEGTPDLELFGQKVCSGDSGDGWSYADGVLTLENFHSDNSSEDFIHVTNVDLEFTLHVKGDNSVKTSGKLIWGSVYGSMTITGEQGASLSLDGKSWSDRYISIYGVTMDVTMQEMIFLAYDMEIDNAKVNINMNGSSGYIYTTHGSFTVKNGSDVTITNLSGVVDYCVATNKAEITDSTLKIINPSGFGVYVTKLSQQASEYKASVSNSTISADVLDAAVHCEEEMSVTNSQLTGSGHFLLRSKKAITVDDSSRMEGIIYEFFKSDTGAVYQVYGSHSLTANLTVAENDSFTIPEGAALTIPDGVTLENNGAMRIHKRASLTGTGALTGSGKFLIDVNEDMISIPEDLTYTGEDYADQIMLEGSITVCGAAFTADTEGWTRNIVPAVVKDAGEYTVTFTKGDKKISKTFTVAQSGTDLKSEGRVSTYNGKTQTTTFTVDDTITVKAAPAATGSAPRKVPTRLQSDYTAPAAGQMALFVGDVQISEPVEAGADGTYTMTVSAADVLMYGTEGQDGKFTLTVKFMGTGNMAAAEAPVKVTVTPNPLDADMVTLDKEKVIYNGAEQKPTPTVKHGENTLATGTDYEVSYTRGGTATTDLTSAGTITVAVTGRGNYGGTVQKTFTIEKASLIVTAYDQTIAYGGNIEEGKEQVTVTGLCGSDTLTDITLTPGTENVPGGTGTIMPSAAKIQNGSGGDASANYDITYQTGTLTIGKIQNAPRMPSAVMGSVSNSCQKVSDVPLPDGWVWQDSDKDTVLEVGVPVSAVAVYNGADSDYYENVTVTVTVTRSDCDHTEGEPLYTDDGESAPSCTEGGLGHTVCTKCGAVVRKYIAVPALGHDYNEGEVTKEPTLEAEGERTYTCKRCGHTYTETIPKKVQQGLWIDHMKPSMNYTGAAVKQEGIEVYYGAALLREKVDYTISYKNNSKAGTAQIIVTGKGNYTGKATESFEIRPVDVGAQSGMTAIVATAVETGKNLKPAVTVTWNGKKLKEKTDYTLSYNTSIKTAGEYEVTISGKGNYAGSMGRTFSVKPRGTKLLRSATVTGIKRSYPYPGSGLAADLQSMVVKMGKTTLVKGTDYTVRTENTDVVGTGVVIIEAAQTGAYGGEKRIAVSITGTDLREGSIKGVEKSYPYTGMPVTPQITVYSGRNGKGEIISSDKYTVSYTSNTEKGKATVTATGIPEKGYSGSVKASYQIGGLNLKAEKTAGNLKVIMPADINHAKGGAKPQPVITYTYEGVTRTLREGADYTLKYSNHMTAAGSKPPTLKITGKGNYSGSITEFFTISRQDIGRLSITVSDRAYGKNRKGSYYYSAPKVYDLDGRQLQSGRDYTVQYIYADSGNPIGKNDKIGAGTKLCAVVAAHEKSSYTGNLRATYVVREAKEVKDIGKVKNDKIENQPYLGSAITPEVRLYTQTGKTKTYLTEESYEVIGCYGNSNRGTATILVRGKGAYSGVKQITFKIVQKKIR